MFYIFSHCTASTTQIVWHSLMKQLSNIEQIASIMPRFRKYVWEVRIEQVYRKYDEWKMVSCFPSRFPLVGILNLKKVQRWNKRLVSGAKPNSCIVQLIIIISCQRKSSFKSCIYCFIVVSMTRKHRSRPWQFLCKYNWREYSHYHKPHLECDNTSRWNSQIRSKERFIRYCSTSFTLFTLLKLLTMLTYII